MNQALPSAAKPDWKLRVRAAIDGPFGSPSQVRARGGELSWVLFGKWILIGANAALMLFLANRLEVEVYGLLVITISGQLLISRLLLLGADAGMVRLSAVPELRSRWQEVVAAGLVLIGGATILLLILSILIAPVLFHFGIPAWIVACIVAGAIGTSLVDYGYSCRLARNEYSKAMLAQGGTAIWRLGLTAVAALKFPAAAVAVFAAYHGASLISGIFQTLLIARESQRPDRSLVRRLFNYSVWVGKANVIVIFSLYQGTLLLMLLDQPAATGVFGLALTLSLGFFAIYNAYTEYLSVRIRSLEHIDKVRGFIARALAGAIVLIVLCVPLVFIVARVMPWIVGSDWLVVIPVFIYLSASMLLLFPQAPLVAACHYLLKPRLIMFAWVMRVVLIGIAGFMLASHGAIGVAIGQLIGSALALVVLSWLVARSLAVAHKVS